MQFDAYGANLPLEHAARVAHAVEELGCSGIWFTETQRPPDLACAVAAEATDAITIGTAIAVAFPRSPMVTAQTAWELARASGGRFSLGLGTQVKAHIERRFSMPYEHPGPKLRDYVLAVRAIFRAFQGEAPLRYEGDFYAFSAVDRLLLARSARLSRRSDRRCRGQPRDGAAGGRGVRRLPRTPVPLAALPRRVHPARDQRGRDPGGS